MTVMRMVWCYDADMDCCMYVRTLLEFCYRWLNVCDVDGYIYGQFCCGCLAVITVTWYVYDLKVDIITVVGGG